MSSPSAPSVAPHQTFRDIPRWVLVVGSLLVLMRAAVAVLIRVDLTLLTTAFDPDGEITYLVAAFAGRQSARDLAFAVLLGIALWTGRRVVAGWLLTMGALVELQDWGQNVVEYVTGTNTAGAAFLVPALTIGYGAMAWRLLRSAPDRR